MEIEIRAKVDDRANLEARLEAEAKFITASVEDDVYFKHETDLERKLVLRIRRKASGSILTFKGKTTGDDTAWQDVDLPLSNPDDLENILFSNNYVKVVQIQKSRRSYALQDYEVNLDDITGLGTFIEIEGRGDETERRQVEDDISLVLNNLGVSKEHIIRKGYVALMLEKSTV
ncbi:MAG: class IV adenylate cyclase [Candidatus Moraniibacteriota bacterium]